MSDKVSGVLWETKMEERHKDLWSDRLFWHCPYCSSRVIGAEFVDTKQKRHSVEHSIKKTKPPLLSGRTRKARDTSSNTAVSIPRLLSSGAKTFQETGEGISLSSLTTDKHRHIKTSMLKSGNSPFNSRQTQCEELNYRTGATQPFWKLHWQ